MATSESIPRCKNLVLDSGPLLSLSPLRGLAATYLTVPQVLDELKDKRAREHFERLGLSAGVKIEVRSPDAASLSYGTLCYLIGSKWLEIFLIWQSYNSQRRRGTTLYCPMLICLFWL
jgi:hypothetical protein